MLSTILDVKRIYVRLNELENRTLLIKFNFPVKSRYIYDSKEKIRFYL